MATKKVYLNTAAQIAGKISTALISIFLVKILTNYLDLEGYGLYSKIYNYLSIFSVVADLGLYTITVREISDHKDDPEKVRKIAGTVLSIRTGMGLAIVLFSLGLAFFLPGYDTLPALVGILIAGIFTLFGLVNSSILSLLQAYLKTEFSFVSTTLGKLANLLSIVAIVTFLLPKTAIGSSVLGQYDPSLFPMLSLAGVMLCGLLGNVVMTGLLYAYSRKVEKVGFVFDREYAKHVLKASLPYGLALFLNAVFFKVDVVLLSILESREAADADIALYGVPMKIVEVGMMFGTVFLNSMLPLFTASIKKGKEELEPLVKKAYTILFFFGAGVALFLAVAAKPAIAFIANPQYLLTGPSGYDAADAMRIVSFVFFFFFLSSLFTYLLIAAGEQKRLLKINALIAAVNLLGNLVFIRYFSFVGSAMVTLVSQILLLFLTAHAAGTLGARRFFAGETLAILAIAAFATACSALALKETEQFGTFLSLAASGCAFAIPYLSGGILAKKYLRKLTA